MRRIAILPALFLLATSCTSGQTGTTAPTIAISSGPMPTRPDSTLPPTTTTTTLPGRVPTSGDLQQTPADQGRIAAQVAEAHMAGWTSEDPVKWAASRALAVGGRLRAADKVEATEMSQGIYGRGIWKIITYTPAIRTEPPAVRLYACVRSSFHSLNTRTNQVVGNSSERIERRVVYVEFVADGNQGGGAWKVLGILDPEPGDKFTCS